MNAPWFDPNTWAWLPGTLFGCLGGLWGAMAGICTPSGALRGVVLGSAALLATMAVGFLSAGLIAIGLGQPYGVWFGLLLPGVQGLIVLPFLVPLVHRGYRQAEDAAL